MIIKKEYNFSKEERNRYNSRIKKQITIRLDTETIDYFKGLSEDTDIPYQTLINLYLQDCVRKKKKLVWGDHRAENKKIPIAIN